MTKKPTGLGRGLSSLLADEDVPLATVPGSRRPTRLPIEVLSPNPYQPRQRFSEELISELVESIREKGVIQPILVRPAGGESATDGIGAEAYEIIAGERRWRAAQAAGLHHVPVIVRELSDAEALQLAIIENVQRQDLSPIEEARGYRRLIEEFGHTQNQLAKVVGKSRSHIANLLRLLMLPEAVIAMIDEGKISMGHARALVGTDDPAQLARTIVSRGLNVRQVERLAQSTKDLKSSGASSRRAEKDADTRALERDIAEALGLAVSIHHRGEAGEVRISYKTLEQLDDLCQRLCQK